MKRQFFILLVGLCISAVVFNSCDKKEISEDPTTKNYTHTINSNNSHPEGTNIKAYDNGQTIKTTNITNNSYKIEFTTNKPTETIDSITATKEGYKKFKITNTTIGTTTKKIDIQLKKIEEDTTKIFWFYANNTTPTTAQIKVFDNGQIHDETTTNNKYKTTNIKLPTDNEIDSVTVTAQGYNKQTFKKINVKEGANKLEFTLTQTTIQAKNIIKGTLTNIQTDEKINGAYIIAWNGETLIYTTTDENGNYELPSNQGINQIKIIKQEYQTRTTYEEGKETNINWNIYNKKTFPLEAIIELTANQTKHFKQKPTIYFIKNDRYTDADYAIWEQLIQDVDDMSQGNTHDLEIKYINDVSELQAINNDDHSFIFAKFVEAQNSTWGYQLTDDQKYMRYASIDIHHLLPEYAEYMYSDFGEEFGSAYLGAWQEIRNVPIQSKYHFDGELNTNEWQPVDSLVTKFHFTRKPNARASKDDIPNESGMNILDNQQEVQQVLLYENGTLKTQTYNDLPEIIKQEIEQ